MRREPTPSDSVSSISGLLPSLFFLATACITTQSARFLAMFFVQLRIAPPSQRHDPAGPPRQCGHAQPGSRPAPGAGTPWACCWGSEGRGTVTVIATTTAQTLIFESTTSGHPSVTVLHVLYLLYILHLEGDGTVRVVLAGPSHAPGR